MKSKTKTIGIRGAAIKLRYTQKYVYDLVYMGRLPAQKVNRQWRIPLHAVETLSQQRRHQ